jgi:fructoselysine 6-kinase
MKIACFTVACVDYYHQLNKTFPGGNALNQCLNFQAFSHETVMIGAVGNDPEGQKILNLLNGRGVDTSHLQVMEGATASNQLYVDESGERFGIEGAWRDGVYGEHHLDSDDWNYLKTFDVWSTHANTPDYQEILKRKTKDQFLVVDFLALEFYDLLEMSLGILDIAYIGGTKEMFKPLADLAKKKNALIVLTLGAEGSIAFSGSEVCRQQALPTHKVVDTTGCGDAFQAAFTSSFIKDRDISKALYNGAVSGRETAAHYGATLW